MPGARVVAGDRVTLRTAEREDVPFLQRAFADPAIRFPIGNPVENRDQVEEWLFGDDEGPRFLVCLEGEAAADVEIADEATTVDTGGGVQPIGSVSVDGMDWRRPELAYWLVPECHGQGYGREAVSLAVDHVFRTCDHPAVEAAAYGFNEASRALLESLGFETEGRLRKRRFVDGAHVDTVQYGLLREDWALSR